MTDPLAAVIATQRGTQTQRWQAFTFTAGELAPSF